MDHRPHQTSMGTTPLQTPAKGQRPSLWGSIREDYLAHGSDWTKPGFRAVAVYRFAAWSNTLGGLHGKLIRAVARFLYRRVRNRYGIELPAKATLGRRVVIEHQGAIVVHGLSVIGDDTIIRQGVTIGNRLMSQPSAAPRIGARVNIGAGAAILGGITIGDDVNIGANAVVIHDVPNGATAVGGVAQIRLAKPV
jgi:serine O-acetyltransferase